MLFMFYTLYCGISATYSVLCYVCTILYVVCSLHCFMLSVLYFVLCYVYTLSCTILCLYVTLFYVMSVLYTLFYVMPVLYTLFYVMSVLYTLFYVMYVLYTVYDMSVLNIVLCYARNSLQNVSNQVKQWRNLNEPVVRTLSTHELAASNFNCPDPSVQMQ